MPRDLGDLAASAARTADALQGAQAQGVRRAAVYATTMIRNEIRSATGDMRLSGVGRKGARVGARFDVKGTRNPTALIRATGPLHLIERDTGPHSIYPKGQTFATTRKGNVRRRGTSRALKIGEGYAAYAEHPGTRGKHPFQKGVAKAAPETPRIFQREVRAAIAKAWT
jgi:hypothetical protein